MLEGVAQKVGLEDLHGVVNAVKNAAFLRISGTV